jgi:hypothetical protein
MGGTYIMRKPSFKNVTARKASVSDVQFLLSCMMNSERIPGYENLCELIYETNTFDGIVGIFSNEIPIIINSDSLDIGFVLIENNVFENADTIGGAVFVYPCCINPSKKYWILINAVAICSSVFAIPRRIRKFYNSVNNSFAVKFLKTISPSFVSEDGEFYINVFGTFSEKEIEDFYGTYDYIDSSFLNLFSE